MSTLVDTIFLSDIEINRGQIRFPSENGSDPKSCSDRSRKTVKGGVGPVAGVSAAWMRGQAPMDGLTASPATGPTPASLSSPAFDVAVEVAGQRPALPQVQGATLQRNPTLRQRRLCIRPPRTTILRFARTGARPYSC